VYAEKQGAEPEIIPRATLAYSGEPEHSGIISGGSSLFFCKRRENLFFCKSAKNV